MFVYVSVCENRLGLVVMGGGFNWSTAAGRPSGEPFTVKSLWDSDHTLVLRSSDGCLNEQHPDT